MAALAASGRWSRSPCSPSGRAGSPPRWPARSSNLEPLVGAIAGSFAFGDPAGPTQLPAGRAILAGIGLSSLPLITRPRTVSRRTRLTEAPLGPSLGTPRRAADRHRGGGRADVARGEPRDARYLAGQPELGQLPVTGLVLARACGGAGGRTVYGRGMDVAELAHLRRARDLLEREYARPLDVPAMARAALMSPSLFARRFREAYGDTPYGYLQARRVERAMALLRRGDQSVTDVCLAVGFTSLGSFSSTFTRLVGEPPSAYRARDHSRLTRSRRA